MNDKTLEILDMIGQAVGKVGEATVRVATEAAETIGQQVRILDLKSEIGRLQREIGRMVYQTHTGVEVSAAEMEQKLAAIDACYEEIEAQNKGQRTEDK